MDFGNTFSNQIMSSSIDVDFWLIVRFAIGGGWCIMIGKYPRRLQNLKRLEECFNFKLLVARLSSNARMKPIIVMARAVNFR